MPNLARFVLVICRKLSRPLNNTKDSSTQLCGSVVHFMKSSLHKINVWSNFTQTISSSSETSQWELSAQFWLLTDHISAVVQIQVTVLMLSVRLVLVIDILGQRL